MESLVVPFLMALILVPVTLLMAFILLCIGIQIMWIGIQIMWNGWAELNGLTP